MKAAVIERPGLDHLKIEELPTPKPGAGVTVGSRDRFEQMLAAISAHRMRPVIDRVFPLAEIRTAIEHLGAGRHVGEVCLSI